MAEENLGTAVLSIVVDSKGLEESLNKAKQQIQKTSRELQRSLTAAPINPATGRSLRDERNDPIKAAIRQRRADQRALQTASGSGLGRFLRDARTREEAEKRINKERQKGFDQGFRKGGARESVNALTDAQKRRYGLEQQIRSLEAAGVNTAKLRAQLGEATTAQANRQFGSFNRIASALDFTLRKERDKLRVIREQNTALERQATEGRRIGRLNASPVRGGLAFPGSPGAIAAAQAEGLRIGRLNAVPLQGGTAFPGSPAAIRAEERLAAARERAAQAAQKAAEAEGRRIGRLNALPVEGGKDIVGSPAAIRAEERLAAARVRAAQAAQKATEAEGRRIGRLNASPVRGGTAFPGSPAAIEAEKALTSARRRSAEAAQRAASAETERTKKEAARRRADVASNALIGGAFPLLFGQGAGAALGGAVGGGAGGLLGGQFGFGGSLVGTALGAALDVAIEKTKTLAQGLDSPIKNFDALKEAALLSSKSVEKNAESLILAGRTQEAAVLIQEDLQRTFGNTESAERLIKASDELNRAWTEVSTATAFFVAGPLADFLAKLRERISPPTTEAAAQERAAEQSRIGSTFKNVGLGVATLGLGVSASGVGVLPGLATAGVGGILAGIGTAVEGQPRPRVPAQGDPVKQEQLRIAAAQEYQDILKKENQLIVTQAQGYDGIAASLERQLIIARAAAAKKADPIQALKIEQDAQKELNKLAERELERKQAIQVQASLEAAQNKLKSQSIAEQIAATQALGKAERGVARDTLATTQAIQLGINEARRREQEIGAQIDAARQRGGDAGEQEASRLVEQQKIAANETRLELEKGALALTEAGEQLRDNLRNAIVDFTRIRSDPQGLNRFLNPQQQDERARQDFQLLLPQFRQAQSRFTQLTGAQAPVFTGPTAGVNDAIRDFIQRTEAESQAGQTLVGTQQALATNLEAYNSTLVQLASVTQTLADKNWLVNVAVSGAQSAISGDVLNGAVSP